MKRNIINTIRLTLFFMMALIAMAGNSQTPVKIKGVVINKQTSEPVPYVHVYTNSLSAGTVTDDDGAFTISIQKTDTVVFSSIGFDKYLFTLKQEEVREYYEVVIALDFKSYELQPVKVTAYKDYEQFKQDILNLNDLPANNKSVKIVAPGIAPLNRSDDPKVVITGPISAVTSMFSREAKQYKKLKEYKQTARDEKLIASRYNVEVVKRLTNLNDEGARKFMEWCRFEEDFILQSSEYDFTVAMLKCLEEFPTHDSIR